MLRRTAHGFEGKLTPGAGGRPWPLIAADVEEHFGDPEINERAWLDALPLGGSFAHVPDAGKAKKKRRQQPRAVRKTPNCALGSLAKALGYDGDEQAATAATAAIGPSLAAKDRVKYAAQEVALRCNYEPRRVTETCALAIGYDECPALVTLKSTDGTCRSHAVTLLRGLIFDSAEPAPLALSREHLTRCLGVPYGGVVRGYRFVPQPKALKRRAGAAEEAGGVAKRARATC